MVIGLWTTSNEQGKIAGANMTGSNEEYVHPKLFSSLNIGDINIFSAGNIHEFDEVYEYVDSDNDIHHKLFVSHGKITGAILFGDTTDLNNLRNAIFSKMEVEEYLKTGILFVKK